MIITWPSVWDNTTTHPDWQHKMTVMSISGIFLYNGEAYGSAEIYGNYDIQLSRQDLEKAGSWPPIRRFDWGREGHQWMKIEMVSYDRGININGLTYFNVKVYRILPKIKLFRRFIRVYVREFRERRENRENRMLAFGMMTHARLGKKCALNAYPELVRMVVRCMDTA